MELKIKVECSDIHEVKKMIKEFEEIRKEHSLHCTLSAEIEIKN